jgi:undecaprenyl-phosphate 4-deoxy-4-formamido-L-arabinose transferase
MSSSTKSRPEIAVVIPVFNGAASVAAVVSRIHQVFAGRNYEIVLVNDGSSDESERVCRELAETGGGRIIFVELSRNFGEHHAVLAGLGETRAEVVAVLDDDGQNPPEELPRMIEALKEHNWDVCYGRYVERKHGRFRRFGSGFNDRVATWMLGKPPGLYLSSFKVMNRFIVDEILNYQGPFPYIDGLICRTTGRLGQIDVQHAPRIAGQSNYTLRRLVRLWLNMFLGFSIVPLRAASLLGMFFAATSLLWLVYIVADKLWISPDVPHGIPTVLALMALFAGVQCMLLGMIGEYLGRVFLAGNGQPQYIVRYALRSAFRADKEIPA